MKLNPEVKAKWVEALRSGEYEQGKGVLRDANDKFCCLGVLCDLYLKEHGDCNLKWVEGKYNKYAHLFDGNPTRPNDVVCKWAGLENSTFRDVHVTISGMFAGLAVHNDKGISFADIADAIESRL